MLPNEKILFDSVLTASALIGAVLLFFIFSILRQQRRYRQLAQAKINAEIVTLENERRRIAADLHDEVGPLLSAIKLQINNIDGSSPEEENIIKKSSAHIDDIIKKMREISNDLLPNVLVRRGLIAAVKDFIAKVQPATAMKISFEHNDSQRFTTSAEVNAYRIVQEIIHNAIKHAEANTLSIQLKIEPNRLQIATRDDGRGFNYSNISKTKSGLGLLNLQSRTDVMSGQFNFESQPGKGTQYFFEIPITTTE